jgi:hypothetical protein
MINFRSKKRQLLRDQTGVAAVEFAFVLPPFLLMFLGAFDLGYSIYFRTVLDGAIQETARAAALESGPGQLTALDNRVTKRLKDLSRDAVVTFERKSYFSYNDVARPERHTEQNGDGICNNNEPYSDENNNGSWDADVGTSGIGGPNDIVQYKVTVVYDRIFPIWQFIGQPKKNTFSATTVLKNQPYGTQNGSGTRVLNCT